MRRISTRIMKRVKDGNETFTAKLPLCGYIQDTFLRGRSLFQAFSLAAYFNSRTLSLKESIQG